MRAIKLSVSTDGLVSGIYCDEIAGLFDEGKAYITRASRVEPTAEGQWMADMAPSGGGPVLGPYRLRSEALEAEREWLEARLFAEVTDA